MSANHHVVTGGTGFVGSAVILELLATTSAQITAIVRPNELQTATERLHGVLIPLVADYQLPEELISEIANRTRAIAGDIEQPRCGISDIVITAPEPFRAAQLEGAELWHCAASLQYQDRHRDQINRTNVDGTANVVELAKEIECSVFNYVSTAYVAGNQTGLIRPQPASADNVNNLYELSKIAAELIVTTSGLPFRVLRPGVVIGHSETLNAISSDGLYGFTRSLVKFANLLERTQPGLSDTLQVTMVADADGGIDLVPVDIVAREAVALSRLQSPENYYHLTNPTPSLIGVALEAAFSSAGLRNPLFSADCQALNPTDRKLQARTDFYSSYIVNAKRFDRSTVIEALGQQASAGSVLDLDTLIQYCNRYVEGLNARQPAAAVNR